MDRQIINFSANEQSLIKTSGTDHYAGNVVRYIEAHFDLGANWTGYDSVRAIWRNKRDATKVSTVLNSEGVCVVPYEVLTLRGDVCMNLVGSIAEDDVLVDRLTTYPICALTVDVPAMVDGTDPASITPSEYEQFVAKVANDANRAEAGATASEASASEASASAEQATLSAQASEASALRSASSAQNAQTSERNASEYAQNASESATSAENAKEDAENARDKILSMRATAETLAEGSQATASYSDGVLTLGIPRGDTGARGEKGETGETGATPNLSIGTVETLEPTESATATITGTAENPVLNLGLPQGKTGEVSYEDLSSLLPKDTASGDIISIPDGQSIIPVESLKVSLEPIQDLHGYDKPWAGGAGKNKFDVDAWIALVRNSTYYSVSDSAVSVIANDVGGISDRIIQLKPSTQYVISFTNASACRVFDDTGNTLVQTSNLTSATFTTTDSGQIAVKFYGSTYPTVIGKVQIEEGSTATAWTPYENIAPISGWTEVNTQRTGKNLWNPNTINSEKTLGADGGLLDNSNRKTSDYIKVKTGSLYLTDVLSSRLGRTCATYDSEKNFLQIKILGGTGIVSGTIQIADGESYVRISTNADATPQVELGSTATDYHAYQGDTYHTEIEGNYTVTSTDNVPYLLKEVSGIDGDRLREKIVGGTVAWNQLNNNSWYGGTVNGITVTKEADGVSWSFSGTATRRTNLSLGSAFELGRGHVYYVKGCPEGGSAGTYSLGIGSLPMDFGNGGIWKNTPNYANGSAGFIINEGVSFNYSNLTAMVVDLTLMLGSTIADYIYNLEQTTAGAGVAFFKSLFPNDYYPYNSGELLSVQTSAHVTKDADDNVLGNYPLDSDLELRGIPKLSDGSLYYDGDTYEADGTVTRKYGVVDLGTLAWGVSDGMFEAVIGDRANGEGICARYIFYGTKYYTDIKNNMSDKQFGFTTTSSRRYIEVRDSAYSDVASFKAAMSGVYLVYELAEPTTEQADPFEAVQKVINGGTEEYIDTRDVPIPVGHETEYLSRVTYGCTIDIVTGECVIDRAMVDLGTLNWTVNGNYYQGASVLDNAKAPTLNSETAHIVSDRVDVISVASMNTKSVAIGMLMSGRLFTPTSIWDSTPIGQLVYELATPQTIQLTPQQVMLLTGDNNVWSDGQVTMVYSADVARWVEKRLS